MLMFQALYHMNYQIALFAFTQIMIDDWFNKCNQCKEVYLFEENYAIDRNLILQEIRCYQLESVVNNDGKSRLEKVSKENICI